MINRDHIEATSTPYELIIVGGGIYGVALAREAGRRGIRALLLERDDFGSATSYNSLRIIHGGFRYLQKFDLRRFFESVGERRWFLQHFPELVDPLPCLMPLYGNGLFRPSILKVALIVNDILSSYRNNNVPLKNHLPGGKVIPSEKVTEIFPQVDTDGLKGGAIWYDGSMTNSQRLLIEMLLEATSSGVTALNYTEVKELLKSGNQVKGVIALDKVENKEYHFAAPLVINTAGPWCRELASCFDRDYPHLFHSSIAWNVLFNHPPLSSHALAVAPKKPGAQIYFLRPWEGLLLAGTIHQPWNGVEKEPIPSETSIEQFIEDINLTVPHLNLTRDDVLHIFSGLLPAKKEGTHLLATREVIIDHGTHGGPNGLISVSGVKFTTARRVAEKVLQKVLPKTNRTEPEFKKNIDTSGNRGIFSLSSQIHGVPEEWLPELERIIHQEAVIHLDDLILRRTNIGNLPHVALELAPKIARLFNWDEKRYHQELENLMNYYKQTIASRGWIYES